jgi:hypothetical protein
MIIIVCTDDKQLEEIASASSQKYFDVFGNYFNAFDKEIPILQSSENLFIIAHGAFDGDEGNPVIGDKKKGFYVNGLELWENLKKIFPVNYTGNVYIDACESADHDNSVFSFIEVFYSQYNLKFTTMVFGINGASSGLIALPANKKWRPANPL